MAVALVTNYLPAYRLPLYRLLAERLGVEVHCFGGEARYVPGALRDLERQIAEAPFPATRLARQGDALRLGRRYDAVIAAVTGRVALPAAYIGARRAGRPFVLWASLWRHPRTAAHLASFPLMRHIYRKADAVVTYGPHVSRYVARYRGDDRDVFVAPQAVEEELARPVSEAETAAARAEHGLGDGPLVLFAGRLEREKGVEVLLAAWRHMRTDRATLCLAGDGSLAGRVRNESGVVVTGRLARDRLPTLYAAADAVVVPSLASARFLEPWGLVCNEAMCQGTPVVATTAVGAAAGGLVRDGETGLVVPAGDAVALAGALERLLSDGALRTRLGRNAHSAVAPYTYEAAFDAFRNALHAAVR